MIDLVYIDGDATNPTMGDNDKPKYIIHCCNDEMRWGSGFVLAISAKWSRPAKAYMENQLTKRLGMVQVIPVEDNIFVCNMIAQKSVGSQRIFIGDETVELPPIRYDALKECLLKIASRVKLTGGSIHLPYKMGSDRAGGDWNIVESLLKECLSKYDIPVFIYKWKGNK